MKPTSTTGRHRRVQDTNWPSDLSHSQQYSPDPPWLSPQQISNKLLLGFKAQKQSLAPNQKESVKPKGAMAHLKGFWQKSHIAA